MQNHLLQILSLLAMDRPTGGDGDAIDAAVEAAWRVVDLLLHLDEPPHEY